MPKQPQIAVSVIPVKEGKVLFGQRADRHGHWEMPGGKLSTGEQPSACARRELREETGLEARNLRVIDAVAVDYFGSPWIVIFYEAEIDGEPVLAEPNKSRGWQWFRWDERPSPLLPGTEALIAAGYRPSAAA
jgi:8-oxo-dGTP diphosphatase